MASLETEVFVVDNCSSDHSVEFLQPKFPSFHFISNKINEGFAKANNQALKLAKGKYVLFLNPDTVIPEDCLSLCTAFMNSHPEAGALGVRMLNGHGLFLRESKRGFPTPAVSFWKMTGLTSMFPRSKRIAGYYMGHLDNEQVNEVDVLSGAFMFVRKAVLDRTGGFDERFFMYAEDIDLSYRITREGYINFYFPETTIIHYKGESTKKGFKYIRQFYKAMSQFVKKHFHSRGSRLFATTLDLAIWLRAAVELIISRKNRKSAKESDEKQTIITNNGTSVKELIRYIEYHPGPKYFIKITTDDASSLSH